MKHQLDPIPPPLLHADTGSHGFQVQLGDQVGATSQDGLSILATLRPVPVQLRPEDDADERRRGRNPHREVRGHRLTLGLGVADEHLGLGVADEHLDSSGRRW